jgi:hypothetical protein
MPKILLTLALLALPFFQSCGRDPKGGIACLEALPPQYRNGVLRLSADNADPDPKFWYVAAQTASEGIHNLTLAAGNVVSDKPALGLRELFSSASPVDIAKLAFDSGDTFARARDYGQVNGKVVESVSFQLQQNGSNAAPVWTLWCYGPGESYLGQMQMLATDGTVVANSDFPAKPR